MFNKVVSLRDTWAKLQAREPTTAPAPEAATEHTVLKPKDIDTRPEKRSRAEVRAERLEADPALAARMAAFQRDFGLTADDAERVTDSHALADFTEAAIGAAPAHGAAVARWITNMLLRELKERPLEALPLAPAALGELVALVEGGTLTSTSGRAVFGELLVHGGSVRAVVARLGLDRPQSVQSLNEMVTSVLEANPVQVQAYRAGKTQLLGFFVGQVLKATQGAAPPDEVRLYVERLLAAG